RYPLLHSEDEPWEDWFDVLGGKSDRKRGPVFDDSLSTAVAAQQGLGLGLARWSLVAAELESGQLVRPINIASKSEFAYYFVAPARYFELPKVALFRAWLEDCCCAFPAPNS
ncbi:MAG: LysR substrate-binding domain-containing protein, partial [Pseudomonadales bacterium]